MPPSRTWEEVGGVHFPALTSCSDSRGPMILSSGLADFSILMMPGLQPRFRWTARARAIFKAPHMTPMSSRGREAPAWSPTHSQHSRNGGCSYHCPPLERAFQDQVPRLWHQMDWAPILALSLSSTKTWGTGFKFSEPQFLRL